MNTLQREILRLIKIQCLGLETSKIVEIASELIGWTSELDRQGLNVEQKN